MNKPKVLLLFTGGTIAQVKDPKIKALIPAKSPQDILKLAPELEDNFTIDYVFIDNVDSTNIQPRHWVRLAEEIYKAYSTYDGFVITHGTDTMSYTASALSYALQNLGKPVVLTGSQLPPDALGTDARTNLVNAFRVATMDLGEVVVVFGTKIIRGNRSSKQSESAFEAFWSPVYPVLGEIKTEIEFFGKHKKRNDSGKLLLQARFVEDVFVFTLTPSIKPKYWEILMKEGIKGFILAGFGPGNVPNRDNSFVSSIKLSTEDNIPVVVTSQCLAGTAKMLIYETGVTALEAGGISGGDMTLEAATTKLMWVLAQTKEISKIKYLMQKNLSGEISA